MDDEKKYITLAKVLSGEATEEERAGLEAWMAGDPARREEWEEMLRLWQQTDEVLATAPRFDADSAWRKVQPRISTTAIEEAYPHEPKRAKTIAIPAWTRYALAAAAVLLIGLFILKPGGNQTVTFIAQRDNTLVILPDSSVVTLREGAVLKHPEQFASAKRAVSLEGEGFFEVMRDEERPFIIDAGAADVTVLGTSFSVVSGKQEAIVTVSTGKVRVDAEKGKASVVLTPGQRGKVGKDGAEKDVLRNNNHLYWKTGVLEYNGTPLEYVVVEINQIFGADISFDPAMPPALRSQAVTITFENQSLDDMLTELCIVTSLSLRKAPDGSFLITAK